MIDSFMPHGTCILWHPPLLILTILGDALTALSYFAIPAVLLSLFTLRRDILYRKGFLLSALFIVFCGGGHLIAIFLIWHPWYWLSAVWTLCTGIISFITLLYLIPILRVAKDIPSAAHLSDLRRRIAQEQAERQLAQTLLADLDHTLARFQQVSKSLAPQ